MSICSRFAVAVHIMAVLHLQQEERTTSSLIASSVGTNPVVIRRILGLLARHGLISVQPGVGGARLLQPLEQVSLLEIYRAVEAVEEDALFAIHQHPNLECPVGEHIQSTLAKVFGRAQAVMEKMLDAVTLADVVGEIEEKRTLTP